jgi:peptidoglycan/xylan/chitin deacetylase (PgdA/CDA1 family)
MRSDRGALPLILALVGVLALGGIALTSAELTDGHDGPFAAGVTPAVLVGGPASPAPTAIAAPFDLPILMYHHVVPALPEDEFQATLSVTTDEFAAQAAYLKCAGYTAITMAQLFDAIDGKVALPERPVMLTFDDGNDDAYTQAYPVLRQHGLVGSFAVITGYIEAGGPFLTWAQIGEMSDAGMEMMSHSVSHSDLGASDDDTVRAQIADSRAALEAQTGREVRFLVYPSGEPFRSGSTERQAQVVALLQEAGYRGALLAGPGSTTQDPAAPFALNRLRMFSGEDVYTFAASIGGPSPADVGCG